MANYTVWMLGASNITVTDSAGDPASLSGFTQGSGAHLAGATIVLEDNAYQEVRIRDGSPSSSDTSFDDNDGNQGLRGSQTIDGVTYGNGTQVEAEYTLTLEDPDGNQYTVHAFNVATGSPSYGTIEGLVFVDTFPPIGVELSVVDTAEGPGSSGQPPVDEGDLAAPPCFTPGTLILTARGWRKVETLKAGDLVITRDHGEQPVRWIATTHLTADDLARRPQFRPIRLSAGSLGDGLPRRDLLVSPQHRFLLSGWKVELLFATSEVLAPAVRLINGATITAARDATSVDYIHLMFDRHEIIQTEGTWTESFCPGETTLTAMETEVRAELLALFPEFDNGRALYPAARQSLKGWETTMLAATPARSGDRRMT